MSNAVHLQYDPQQLARRQLRATAADIRGICERMDEMFESKRLESYKPTGKKEARLFSTSEAAELLGISIQAMHRIIKNPSNPDIAGTRHGRLHFFTLEQIWAIRKQRGLLPAKKFDIQRAVVIAVANFKGGVAKTFTSVTLAQYLALRGFRTLIIDSDPQASASTTFGFYTDEIDDSDTLLPWIYGKKEVERLGLEMPTSLRSAIRKTYWHGLDIVPSHMQLSYGEIVLMNRRAEDDGFMYHHVYDAPLDTIRSDYDVILIDTAPQLSLSTTAVLNAADGLLVPTQAEYLDCRSTRLFYKLLLDLQESLPLVFGTPPKEFEFKRCLCTRYKDAQAEIAQELIKVFADFAVLEPMVESAAISRNMGELHTLYEAQPGGPRRAALARAMDSANRVNGMLEADILRVVAARNAAEAHRRLEAEHRGEVTA